MLNSSGRPAARVLLIPILALSWLLLTATSAIAISAPIHITGTGGEGVFIRPEPNTSHPAIGWIPEGASPDYHCFAWGQNINGVPIWFNVTYNGVTGYYASYYDDSSYHSNEELTAKYGVPLCGSAPPPPSPPPAPAPSGGSGLVFTIFNADGGVYYRNSPSWSDTSRTPGVGVYNGDRVRLICGAYGEPVGPYANRWWSYVENLSRAVGTGWVNAHFINDEAAPSTPSPGESACGPGTPGASNPSSPSSSVGAHGAAESVFFSPNQYPDGLNIGDRIADHQITFENWTDATRDVIGHWSDPNPCDYHKAINAVAAIRTSRGIDTLAGWSKGRLGPVYVISDPTWRTRIHRIILFDPGNTSDFSPKESCENKLPVGRWLAEWVSSNPHNELLVLTGEASDEWEGGSAGRSTFHGLWHWYFPQIWNQPFAGQVHVCDYPFTDHETMLWAFSSIVEAPEPLCPNTPWNSKPQPWSP